MSIHAAASSATRLVIVFAMWQEAEPLIRALQLERRDGLVNLPAAQVWSSPSSGSTASPLHVDVVWNGRDERYHVNNVATTAAAVTAFAAIGALSPTLVLSAGTAGGFAGSGAIVRAPSCLLCSVLVDETHLPRTK